MTEINNNIPNFGHKIEKINKEAQKPKHTISDKKGSKSSTEYVADTGVLGRSQVKTGKGADIAKSVDEAVALAKNHPGMLYSCDKCFTRLYKTYLAEGMTESDAYIKAMMAEEEFMDIAQHHCSH